MFSSSFTIEVSSPHGLHTVFSPSFILTYFHFFILLNCYRAVMPPTPNHQALPSFNITLHPNHCRTVLPNLSYPSRSSTHIPWAGSSAPPVFSVGQTFFLRVSSRPYVSPPQKTTRQELTVATTTTPNVQVSYTSNSDADVDPSSIPGSHSQYML